MKDKWTADIPPTDPTYQTAPYLANPCFSLDIANSMFYENKLSVKVNRMFLNQHVKACFLNYHTSSDDEF
jgi:hypothetical protein